MIGAEITRIVTPESTYGWLVRADDIMLDLIVRDGKLQRLDRSTGFSSLHVNDLKRLSTLRTRDMLELLGFKLTNVTVERMYLEIPKQTYQMLISDDTQDQQTGFNELMVWVGKHMSAAAV